MITASVTGFVVPGSQPVRGNRKAVASEIRSTTDIHAAPAAQEREPVDELNVIEKRALEQAVASDDLEVRRKA